MTGAEAGADFTPRGGPLGFFFMVGGMFMAILDIQIVASSLPEIQAGVSASIDEITWVQTAYLVAEVVMIPLSGWLARVMSTRWLFATSAAGFTIMSFACALAWNSDSLVFFRAIQGFIGGAMIPTVFAANFKLFPPERQMFGTVIIGLTATAAPALGPTVGGWLTETFTWHWLFLANILPGIAVTIAVPLLIDIDRPNWRLARKIDIPGVVLVAGFLGSLELVLDEGPRNDWFADRYIAIFTAISALSALLLIWRELTAEHPVIELRTFLNRNFTVGCALAFVLGFCMYGQSYILPQILARISGFNALQIGHVMFVTGASMFLTAPLAGRLSSKVDPRKLLTVGFLTVAAGLWLNTEMTADVAYWELFPQQIFRGVGLMLCMVPITAVSLGTLSKQFVGAGSGLFNVFRNMGGAVGLAMINTIWNDRFHVHYWWIAENLSDTREDVTARLDRMANAMGSHAGLNADPQLMALKALAGQVTRQASVIAWNDVFFVIAMLFVVAVPLIFLLSRPRNADVAAH